MASASLYGAHAAVVGATLLPPALLPCRFVAAAAAVCMLFGLIQWQGMDGWQGPPGG